MQQARLWWWVLCILFLAFLSGFVQYEKSLQNQLEQLETEHLNTLSSANSYFSRELGDLRNSMRLVASHLQDLITRTDKSANQVEEVFKKVGGTLPRVSQIRWMDLQGNELFRTNFTGLETKNVMPQELQNKQHRAYFKKISQTLPGQLILSKINLNVENGQIIHPFEPTVRALIHSPPTHPLGEGYLVVNFRLTSLFSYLATLSQTTTGLLIAYDDHSWLLHSDKALEWSSDLKTKPASLPINNPRLWEPLRTNTAVSVKLADEGNVYSANHTRIRYSEKKGDSERIFFIAQTPASHYGHMVERALLPALITGSLVFLLGCILLYREISLGLALQKLTTELNLEKDELADTLAVQRQLREELVEIEKMASLGMLVAGVAHEMNTPLGAALMSVSDMQVRLEDLKRDIQQGLKKSSLDHYLQATSESSALALSNLQRASNLIKRFKRLAVDRTSENCSQFNLYQCIHDLLRAMQPQLKQHNVNIEIVCSKTIYMHSFPGILSQVLQNLINNCMHHAFEHVKKPAITIEVQQRDQHVVLTVTDNGQGVDEEVQNTLFEPFITSNRQQGNTGLGLHLVHQWVCQVMEGKIQVIAPASGGTQFELILPLSVSQPE